MTTATHETQISADPKVPLIRITREFNAPPEKVFRAHTDRDLLVQWLGPRNTQMRVDQYDCRTGGSYRYVHVSDGDEYIFSGCFHLVRSPEVIIQTFGFVGPGMEDPAEAVSLERLVLEDLGDGRTRLTTTSLVESFEARDGMIASGMEYGVREGYERLDELLAR